MDVNSFMLRHSSTLASALNVWHFMIDEGMPESTLAQRNSRSNDAVDQIATMAALYKKPEPDLPRTQDLDDLMSCLVLSHRAEVRKEDPSRSIETVSTARQRLRQFHTFYSQNRDTLMVERLATRLPKELISSILAELVTVQYPKLYLYGRRPLLAATMDLLGLSDAALALWDASKQALLHNARIRFNMKLRHPYQNVEIPIFISDSVHTIHHLYLECNTTIDSYGVTYPTELYRLTNGAHLLPSYLPVLHTLTVVLAFNLPKQHPRGSSFLDYKCRYGFSGLTTFRLAISSLLKAVSEGGPGKRRRFRLKWVQDDNWRRLEDGEVEIEIIENGDIEYILQAACEDAAMPESPVQSPPPKRQRQWKIRTKNEFGSVLR